MTLNILKQEKNYLKVIMDGGGVEVGGVMRNMRHQWNIMQENEKREVNNGTV